MESPAQYQNQEKLCLNVMEGENMFLRVLLTPTPVLWHISVHTYTHHTHTSMYTYIYTLNNFLNCTAKSNVLLIALWVLISLLCAPPPPCHQISNTSGIIRGGKPHNVLMRGRTHGGHKAAVLTASIILRKSWKKQQLSKLCAFAFFPVAFWEGVTHMWGDIYSFDSCLNAAPSYASVTWIMNI